MKKIFTLILLSAFAAGSLSAQEASKAIPKRYINFSYINQEMNFEDTELSSFLGGKSKWGAGAEFGTTYMFNNRKPLAGMVRIGLDYTYLNIQYAQFKGFEPNSVDAVERKHHLGQFGMQLGPSITVSPFRKLHAKAYVRYAPSVVAYLADYEEDANVFLGFAAQTVVYGASVSYGCVTVGLDMSTGSSKLKDKDSLVEAVQEEGGWSGLSSTDTFKAKMPNTRIYVGFRF